MADFSGAVSCASCECDCCGANGVYCGTSGKLGYSLSGQGDCSGYGMDKRFYCSSSGTWYECDPNENWSWEPLESASDGQMVDELYCCYDDSQVGHWDAVSCEAWMEFNPEFDPQQSSHLSVPTSNIINSEDGYITIGIGERYDGAIVYYKDSRLPSAQDSRVLSKNNIIDYSNGGTLLSFPIWTMPPDTGEMKFCYSSQMIEHPTFGQVCPGTLPFNNPTQGGYVGNGYAGNPNPVDITIDKRKISIKNIRGVNYNFAYSASQQGSDPRTPYPGKSNQEEWQTYFWQDMEISFHPQISDVVVIENNITYCKDMSSNCKDENIVMQDIQIPAFFIAGKCHPGVEFRGPYSRVAYKSRDVGYIIEGPNTTLQKDGSEGQRVFVGLIEEPLSYEDDENWIAALQETADVGVGMSVENYKPRPPTSSGKEFGYKGASWVVLSVSGPEIERFEHSGVHRKESVVVDGITYEDMVRYEFEPGGWFKFRVYLATGDIDKIRNDLIEANKYVCNDDSTDGSGICRASCGASTECDSHMPGYLIPSCLSSGTKTYHHDKCNKNCQSVDRDSTCLKEGYSDCTGDPECHLITAGTNDCTLECKYENIIEGDLNGDDVVDISDLTIVSYDFGLDSTSSGWDPDVDLVADGKINIYDLVYVATRLI